MKYIIIAFILFCVYNAAVNSKTRRTVKRSTSTYKSVLLDYEKQQREIIKEQERQYKEVEKLAREQEKQAAQLAKHEQQIQDLYYKVEKCEDEIAHFSELADRLTEQRDAAQAEIDAITAALALNDFNPRLDPRYEEIPDALRGLSDGEFAVKFTELAASKIGDDRNKTDIAKQNAKLEKRRDTLQNKVIALDNRIFAADQKMKKAMHEKEQAEKTLSA